MNGSHCLAVACLISAVVGCSSASIRYYTLTPPPDRTSARANTTLAIDVRVIHTPPQLSRTELMVRASPTEVVLLDNERWASSVKDEIKDALRLALQRRLGDLTDLRSAIPKLTVTVDVQHFEAELGRYALVETTWSLAVPHMGAGADEPQAVTCTFRADEKIAAGYAAMVNGYQRDIAALADAIVAELKRRASGVGAACGQTDGSYG